MVQINPPPSTFLSEAAGQPDTIPMALFQACLAAATSISAQEEVERPLRVPPPQQDRCFLIARKGTGQKQRVESLLWFVMCDEQGGGVQTPLMSCNLNGL